MNGRLYWEGLYQACVGTCLEAQCQKQSITCPSSKTYPPWHLTVWFQHSCLNVRHHFVQQMRAGRHSAPRQLCLLTSSVINGGYKINGNGIFNHYKLLCSLWQCSDPQVVWKCSLFSWFLLEPVSLCVGAVCGCDMAQSGFFIRNGDYLCPLDFQRLHGTPCNNCREFVEGEVVTVLGKTYHPACFVCNICK